MNRNNKTSTGIFLLILVSFIFMASTGLALELAAEADNRPWSGWWWPSGKAELVVGYNGRPSPAEKYDLYATGTRPGEATINGSDKWYVPDAESWEGMCNGWVNASILESGSIIPSSANGVFLSVGDKKGLLTACHYEDEVLLVSCLRKPEIFHHYLLKYIGEQGEIIGADLDSTRSFWSYPIYSYNMSIASGDASDYVTCTIKYATDFVDPDYQGTFEHSATYRYRLDKDAEGNYEGGEWLTEDSDDLHPQSVWIPIAINQNKLFIEYAKVKEMADTVDDELEGQDLVPGHHLLIIYPGEEDSFKIRPQVGENITCRIALDPQSVRGNSASYRLQRNHALVATGDLNSELQPLSLNSDSGSDELQLTLLPGMENSVGVCVHLYVDIQAQYQSWFYGFPSESYWVGCAATSLNESTGARFWLEIAGDQGLPVGCGQSSGDSLNPEEHWLSVLDNNLTEDYFRGDGKAIGFKLISSTPFQGLLLAGNSNTLRGPPESCEITGSKLVIPWLTNAYNMHQIATFHLANANAETVSTKISYFKNDGGTPLRTADVELAPQTTVAYSRGNYPEQGGVNGWAVVESSGAKFSGGVVLGEGYKRLDQLPLLRPGRGWVASHLVVGNGWQTVMGFCNLSSEPLTLSLTAFIDGDSLETPYSLMIDPFAKHEMVVEGALFGLSEEEINRAWIRVDGNQDSAAYLRYRYSDAAGASIPLAADVESSKKRHKLSQLAVSGGWWTGIVLLNSQAEALNLEITALSDKGEELQRLPLELGPYAKFSASVASIFNEVKPEALAQLRLDGAGASAIKAMAFYGGMDGVTFLAVHSW